MKQTLYFGGPILTMEEGLYAEALLVEGGRIRAVASLGEAEALAGPSVRRVDLKGRALLPAFIDAHSHFTACAGATMQAQLGDAASFADIQRGIKEFIRGRNLAPGVWVTASGYDHNALKEKAHPTRWVLDEAAPDNPVLLTHQSSHMGVANSAALKALGLTPDTPAPQGGRRAVENGELTGYLEETAFTQAMQRVPMPSVQEYLAAYAKAQQLYARYGVATVQEGMMPPQLAPLLRALMDSGMLKLDVVGYADLRAGGVKEAFADCVGRYHRHFRLGGYKIFLDGSPQGRTAWMLEPYENAPDGYRGYPTLSDEEVRELAARAAGEGMQLLAHCNGDAAAEQYITACEAVARRQPELKKLRNVIIHAQLTTPAQLARAQALGMMPSFFIAHIWQWGEVHLQNFGPRRAARLSAAGASLRLGQPFTFHQDSPVLPPDMLRTVWCAVRRQTKQGRVLGEDQRISVLDALKAVTIHAAYQYFEEGEKGSLAPGKRADLVILNADPLAVPVDEIPAIQVLETIKDGETVFCRGEE